ncbi:MAG TPA: toxin-antitoxin (TA) system antitoxin [Anaerolineae bacterium]|nr:toxin-antitoxin (TA) system antitoxin [Anaerolineae bacterium]HID84887.1 toxin-antitoxin (TA) system antitoxin [Anaerolineales bacterium]HIQ07941.1 toxin-antitoxin (TA) system antitoxin [Anaerolineaceae bacterium]
MDVQEAQKRFRELVAGARAGEEWVLVDEGDTPIARLVPLGVRVTGLHPGAFQTKANFDAPLPEAFWTDQQ